MSGGSDKKNAQDIKVPSYWAGVHFVLCRGPIDGVDKIYVDNRELTSTAFIEGSNLVLDENLFGGLSREGGVIGIIDIAFGWATQAVNSYLTAKLGTVPAYRGVVSVILRQVYLGLNYYFKPWTFLIHRIHKRLDGTSQWQEVYCEMSEAAFTATLTYPVFDTDTTFFISPISSFNTLYVGNVLTIGTEKVVVSGIDRINNILYVERGAFGTSPADTGLGTISNYHGIGTGIVGYSPKLINPIHVIRECLTSKVFGLGFSDTRLDDSSFLYAASICSAEGMGFSWFWDKQSSIDEFIVEVLKHINGVLYVDSVTNLFTIYLIRKLTDTTGFLTLNTSNVKELSSVDRKQLSQMVNKVTVEFTDVISGQNNSVTMTNDSLIARHGYVVAKSEQYSGIVTPLVAQKIASRTLQIEAASIVSTTIVCNRDAENLHLGQPFFLDMPLYFDSVLTMRVKSINLGNNISEQITIEAFQDCFAEVITTYNPPMPSGWVNPITYPVPCTVRLITEVPYYILAKLLGDSTAQSFANDIGFMVAAAKAPTSDTTGASIWISSGGGYVKNGNVSFCFNSTIVYSITSTSTSITLSNSYDIEHLLILGEFIQIDDELLSVTAITGNILIVGRGVLDTVPVPHSSGAIVLAWQDFNGSDKTEYLTGETISVKLTPITPLNELDIIQAPADSLTFLGRQHLPYPPGNVKVNSVAYPNSITGSATISWSHRDRLQQTANLVGTTNGNIGPETGTTYTLRLYDSSNTLVRTVSGITGTSYFWGTEVSDIGTGSLSSNFRFELESIRNGMISWQKHNISIIRTGSLVSTDSPLDDPTSLIATGASTGITWSWSTIHSGTYSFELAISPVNDRDSSSTVIVAVGTAISYLQILDTGIYYAWVRAVYDGKVGNWVPSGSTSGISGSPQDDLTALLALVTP